MFSSYSKANIENRALQRSIRDKYNQKLNTAADNLPHLSKNRLSRLAEENANVVRLKRLVLKLIIGIACTSVFFYFVYGWIIKNVFA